MSNNNPFRINEGARRMIFFGIPAVPIMLVPYLPLEHIFGERAYPYILFGAMGIIATLGMVGYNFIPKRLIVPLGIIGWLLTASILCWYGWFGPGTFGHSSQQW